jgi:hypothetical protein
MFLGISLLAAALHVVLDAQETVLSPIARAVFGGRHVAYFVLQTATVLILVLAGNTSYADFPRPRFWREMDSRRHSSRTAATGSCSRTALSC